MRTVTAPILTGACLLFTAAIHGQDGGVAIRLSQPVLRVSESNITMLIQRPDVQGALALGMRQRAAIRELFASPNEQRLVVSVRGDQSTSPESLQGQVDQQIRAQVSGRDARIKAILRPEQWDRLLELELQWRGPMALADADVAKRVSLSAETRARIAPIAEQYRKEKSEVLASLSQTQQNVSPDGSRRTVAVRLDTSELDKPMSPARKRLEKAKREADQQILAALTPEERERWKTACGEPFTFRTDLKGHRF